MPSVRARHAKAESSRAPLAVPVWWKRLAPLVILLCWTPVFLAAYPGFFSYDAGRMYLGQWSQVESGVLNAHHPVLHTLFLKYSIGFGQVVFGSFNAGVAFSVCIQALALALFFGFVLRMLVRLGMGRVGFAASTAYFALHPIVSMFALCTTKDVASSAFFVALCLVLGMIAREGQGSALSWIAVCTCAFFTCALRSNLLVALVVSIPLLYFVLPRGVRMRAVAVLGLAICLALVWLVPVAAILGVEKSPIGAWNALGVPMQQMARCADDPNVSEQDRQLLHEKLGELDYHDDLSDTVRGSFMDWRESDGAAAIAKTYVRLGVTYPSVYLDAFLLHTYDAWSPFAVIDCYWDKDSGRTSVFSGNNQEPATRESKLPALLEAIEWVSSYRGIESIPVLGLVVSIPFHLLFLLLALVRSVYERDRFGLAFTLPLAVASFGCLLGPCMLFRYFLFVVFALPTLAYVAFRPRSEGAARALYTNASEEVS